jgi:ribonuclease P protein component
MESAEGPARGRRGRISRSRDFDAVYRRGRSAAGRHLVVYVFPREEANDVSPARLGLSVSRKVGDAVTRNRVKRVLREQFARHASQLPPGVDVVVIARPGCPVYLAEQGSDALGDRFGDLVIRVLGAPPAAPAPPDAA